MVTELQREYLEKMGIDVWQSKDQAFDQAQTSAPDDAFSWQELEHQVTTCTLCDLHKTRTHAVFGVGNDQADLLVIGEAPGATEDAKGEPFVGRAGKLLDSMLEAIDLQRQDIFIANILKCRPPSNRDPQASEVKLCTPYLTQQIQHIQPKLIVAVGRIAAHFLLDTNESMKNLRGQTFTYGEDKIPLIVTYHPAYLLRSPREKAKSYVDVLRIKKML